MALASVTEGAARFEPSHAFVAWQLTAWTLKVAEYQHQFQVTVEAQKTFVAREMMPKDIKR